MGILLAFESVMVNLKAKDFFANKAPTLLSSLVGSEFFGSANRRRLLWQRLEATATAATPLNISEYVFLHLPCGNGREVPNNFGVRFWHRCLSDLWQQLLR